MPDSGENGPARRRPRRWSFGGCEFDEASWSLKAGGDRVAIEAKPLELLRALLERAGNVVSKDELLDSIWPDVTVVEASLPTAVYKLRAALGDTVRERRIIETVSGLGYRISIPVEVADSPTTSVIPIAAAERAASAAGPAAAGSPAANSFESRKWASLRTLFLVGLVLSASTLLVPIFQSSPPKAQAETSASFSKGDAGNALRRLDVDAVERMLAAGWSPNTPFDDQGNGAFGYLLNMCEWDHGHDRRRMLLMARTLIDGGAHFHVRNVWGDTPYSIAKAERYCGPDHPVTLMLHRLCATGPRPLGDRCMASYEIARGGRFDFSIK